MGTMNDAAPSDPRWIWWRDGVIYHVYLRSFADSDGDGLGDLPGLVSRLDYLNGASDSLGVDAIWLSPCFPSPDRDFGYDVADYTAIDPRFGTMADFDRLIDGAHRRGIRVLLDLVYNHTSDEHAWFRQSRSSRDNPRRDWYEWRDGGPGGRPLNNWKSTFGGRAWTWDPATRQYYHHLFVPQQPDLNWRNPEVRAALWEAARFWLDRGVDGFRLDVFNAWYEHPDMLDNPVWPGLRPFGRRRFLNEIDQPEMHGTLAELRSILDAYPDRASVGEPLLATPERAASYCGDRGLHMVFNFEIAHCRWNAAAFGSAIERGLRVLPADGWPCWALGNHDLRRFVSRFGGRRPDDVARVAAALLLTQRGTPFIYYGEEIGMPDVRLRHGQIQDPPGLRYWPFYKGRDGCRAPLPWNAGTNGGFTTGTPWLPLASGFAERNVELQRRDPRSVWSFYRDLLALRRASAALRRGSFEMIGLPCRRGLAYRRNVEKGQALVGLNFGPSPLRLGLRREIDPAGWRLALCAHADREASLARGAIELGPFQAAVFLSN
jgi:alpha-glucosidase